MNNPFAEEDIIRFIREDMSMIELSAFNKELESNSALAEEVESMRLSLSIIDRRGEEYLKQRFIKLEKRNLLKKWIYVLIMAVSVIALGFILKKAFTKEEPIEMRAIYANNFEKYRPPVTIRNDEAPSDAQSSAIEAYNTSEYEKAFGLFTEACGDSNNEACFYAVLSAVYGGGMDYQLAKNKLPENSPYQAIVLWYEALNYLKEDRKEEAKRNFDELIELGTFKKDESMRILGQLGE